MAQTVTVGEQKVISESLKFSPAPQVENPFDCDSDSSTSTPSTALLGDTVITENLRKYHSSLKQKQPLLPALDICLAWGGS